MQTDTDRGASRTTGKDMPRRGGDDNSLSGGDDDADCSGSDNCSDVESLDADTDDSGDDGAGWCVVRAGNARSVLLLEGAAFRDSSCSKSSPRHRALCLQLRLATHYTRTA